MISTIPIDFFVKLGWKSNKFEEDLGEIRVLEHHTKQLVILLL